MQDEQPEITSNQARALALLLAGTNIEATAGAIGVNPATIHRWLNDPEFAEELRRGRRQLVEHAATKMQAAAEVAATTVIGLMQNKRATAGIRLRAALAVLEMNTKWIELEDLQARLEALEQRLGGQ